MADGKRKGKGGLFLILAGTIFLLGALGLVLYNLWDGNRAAKASAEISAKLESEIDAAQDPGSGDTCWAESGLINESPGTRTMPTAMVDGYSYIGELEIPDESLKLPVMADWDYEQLKMSPCRYSGSYLTDDLVICGHNYQRHFSPIRWLKIGAEVTLVTVDQKVITYTVSNMETVQPTSIEQMVENDKNAAAIGVTNRWDLTLFTCNTGGQTRYALRCIRTSPLT